MNARLGKIALLLADGESDDLGAERLGGVFGKAAPSAADLQKLLARPQIDGLGKPAIFVMLGCGQVRRVVLEQRRRICHAGIEPRRIERVADVVMRIDVAAGLPFRISVEPVSDGLKGACQRVADQHGLHPVLVDAEQIEELREVGRVPFAAQISLGNADVAAAHEPRGEAVIVNLHRGHGARPVAAQTDHAAVGQCHVERAVLEF